MRKFGPNPLVSPPTPAPVPALAALLGSGAALPAPAQRLAHRNLPLLLLHARESVIAHFRPLLNAHGLTEQQWRVVRALLDAGPLEPRQIVVQCRISSPSLAGVLARMDGLGLVTRERLPEDARRLRVSLTAAGRTLAATLAPLIEATYCEIEDRIGSDFSARFYRTLDALIALLGGCGAGVGADLARGGLTPAPRCVRARRPRTAAAHRSGPPQRPTPAAHPSRSPQLPTRPQTRHRLPQHLG